MAKFVYDALGGKPKFEKWNLEPSYYFQPNLLYDFGEADEFEMHKLDDDSYFKLPNPTDGETKKIGELLKNLKSAPEGWFQKLADIQEGADEDTKKRKTLEFIFAIRFAVYDTKIHHAIFSQDELSELGDLRPLLSSRKAQVLEDNKTIAEEQLNDENKRDILLKIASGKVA